MPSTDAISSPTDLIAPAQDASGPHPLAPLIDELRALLEGPAQALARFARAGELHSAPGQAALDPLALQPALHQASGALQGAELPAPALLAQSIEAALLRLAQEPARCTPEAAATLENACLALLEYLEALHAGPPVAAVALFAQYRAVQALAGNDKVHPADLWPAGQHLHEPAFEEATPALAPGPQARALLDAGVLALVKTGQPGAAAQLRAVCLGLAAAQPGPDARSFWKIAAGFFEALAQGRLQPDVYAKRAASRVLMQYAAMAKGDDRRPERLTQELLFFCAQAQGEGRAAPVLEAVRAAFGLEGHRPVDYERPHFGHIAPTPDDAVPAAALSLAPEGSGKELRAIFLEEARAAVGQGLQALDALAAGAAPAHAQAELRRAFHTLKSSARLDGRDEFGEAGWALEQMLNAALSGEQPLSADAQALAREALQAFAAWTEAIGAGQDQDWSATPFRAAADAMRLEGRRAPVALRPARRRRETPAPEPLGNEIKQIDHLRIPLPLYNAYLNEADEWSRCLETALRYPELGPAIGCAQALASRSAAVGFEDLSRLARALAQALALAQGAADAPQRAVFQAAADEIRRLLHQFAAGFLKAPLPSVEAALQQLPASGMPGGESAAREAEAARGPLLAQLIHQCGEVLSARSRIDAQLVQARSALQDLDGTLERLRQQLHEIEAQTQTRPELTRRV